MTRPVARDPWFLYAGRNGEADMRLMCFPFAGGGASVFRGWADAFPAHIDVRAVQLPGRESRIKEPRERDLTALARRATDALLPYFDRPVALFGYSFGGLLAFEIARELRRRSAPAPSALFVAATIAPQLPCAFPPIAHLPDDEFVAAVERYFDPTDPAWKIAELRELFMPVLRDDIRTVERYEYRQEPPLDCPIHIYAGTGDHVVPLAGSEAWREQTTSTFSLTVYAGGHFFLHDALADLQQDLHQKMSGRAAPDGHRPYDNAGVRAE